MAAVLYSAMKTNTLSEGEDEQGGSVLPTFDIGSKLSELKQTRKLGTKITMKGNNAYYSSSKGIESLPQTLTL